MKNKAFTLVELLGVIVLLGILGVVIIPKVGDSITNSKETAYITQEEQIKKAAYDFIVDNIELFDNTNTITIKLGVLKQKGYLPINIKNPKTRKNISNESTITITKTNEKFEITLNLIDLIEVTENIDNNSPIIVLNGNYVEYINVNSNETEINSNLIENGAKAYSSTGVELTEITTQIKIGETEKTSIKTNTLDTYEITYTVTDNGKTTSATRTVIIRDNEAPQITFQKETNLHVSEVETFNLEKDLVITDNYDSNPILTINSTLANRPGNYVVMYTAIDSSGNQTTERRVINVDGNFANYYTNLEYIESTGTQYIDTGVIANQDTGFDIDFISYNEIAKGTAYGSGTIFGARKTYRDSGFQLTTFNETNLLGHFLFGTNNTITNIRYSAGIIPGTRQQISFRNRVLTLPDNTTTSVTNYTFETPSTLTIFALHQTSISENGKVRLYNFKLYDGDRLIRDFMPCYRNSDGLAGLYDEVNDTFYTNAGTGEFVKGNPIN